MGRRRGLLVAVVLAALACSVLAPARPVSAEPAESLFLPLHGTVTYVDYGDVEIDGTTHVVLASLPPSPILPPNPIRVNTNLIQVVATNLQTGETCVASGASEAVVSDTGGVFNGGTLTFQADYQFTPTDPCRSLGAFTVRYLIVLGPVGDIQSSATIVASSDGTVG